MALTAAVETSSVVAFAAAVLLYGFSLGSATIPALSRLFILDLFTKTPNPVHFSLGYLGFCVSPPNGDTTTVNTNSTTGTNAPAATATSTSISSLCTSYLSFPTGEPSRVIGDLIYNTSATTDYNTSLESLFTTARSFHHSAFRPGELVGTCILLGLGGILLSVIAVFRLCRRKREPRRGTFYWLCFVALLTTFGFMLAGGATFALCRGQNLLEARVAGDEGIALSIGKTLSELMIGALSITGIFVIMLGMTVARRAAHRPSTHHEGSSTGARGEWTWVPVWVTALGGKQGRRRNPAKSGRLFRGRKNRF